MTETRLQKSPTQLRAEVEALIRDDLIGPKGGANEEILEYPIDVYLLGLLAPRFSAVIGGATGAQQTADGDSSGSDGDEPEELLASDLLPEDDLASGAGGHDSIDEGAADDRPPAVDQLIPSAFGLTVALAQDCDELEVTASWGTYNRKESETTRGANDKPARVWKRQPSGGSVTIKVGGAGALGPVVVDRAFPEVIVRGLVRERGGHRLVSLFLVNDQTVVTGRSVSQWLCQAELSVQAPDGAAAFVRRPIDVADLAPAVDRDELAGLEMQFRSTVELAVGHGVGVEAVEATDDPQRGVEVTTAAMPAQEVPRTDAPGPEDFEDDAIRLPFTDAVGALDMAVLSRAGGGDEVTTLLAPLVDAYEAWIGAQQRRVADPVARLAGFEQPAADNIKNAREAAQRIRAGIAALADPDVADAFRFANHAMWQQRVHTIAADARRRDPALKLHRAVEQADIPKNRSWRPFQLAFVLLNLPALADPKHAERSKAGVVDLLFFPTGGGKTEAYLGLTAFAIAIRRLQGTLGGRNGRDGVAVLMRYTLRLLTLQQFQRAAALMCACELRRFQLYGDGTTADQRRWGDTPIRIGLWVGQSSTPNRTEDAAQWVKDARSHGGRGRGSSPMQLARCPWCGSELSGGRDVDVDEVEGRTRLTCSDTSGECPFTPRNSNREGLPVIVVDREVYRLLPALVIATVDKLARMPWEGRVQSLFGQVSRRCERHGYLTPTDEHPGKHPRQGVHAAAAVATCEPLRPPDLIIQDELHLISGPLGSLVGLYETAVDTLATWELDGVTVRPKVIASTATIRRARDQVKRLFDRRLAVFPPPGLDARDSFFALQRDDLGDRELKPGRRYLGVCAPGRRYKQVLIRAYVAQLKAAWEVLGRQPGEDADAYMTLVGYFNSLRELGGMRRLVEDDVQQRLFGGSRGDGRGRLILEEMTSRKSAAEIPGVLDQLGVRRTSQARRPPSKPGEFVPLSIDVLLATNMISVGVDVPRLGAMVVAGQPKSTSEYIQATSRVGRDRPGLVISVYNWARPRDLSHYETFCHYHRTLYRQVEAMSVTPFAPRALDRGLTGVLASLLRLCGPDWNANDGAAKVDPVDGKAVSARAAIRARADDQLEHVATAALADRVDNLLDAWKAEAAVGQRNLVYQRRGKSDADVSLLLEPAIEGWSRWTVPTSMRNVETTVPLVLRPTGISPPTDDWEPPERSAPLPDTGPSREDGQSGRRAATVAAPAHLRGRRDGGAARDHGAGAGAGRVAPSAR